jgi:hypothetical protein
LKHLPFGEGASFFGEGEGRRNGTQKADLKNLKKLLNGMSSFFRFCRQQRNLYDLTGNQFNLKYENQMVYPGDPDVDMRFAIHFMRQIQ